MFDLSGKVAVVTGGASGIGQAIAALFSKQGAEVWIVDLNASSAEEFARGLRDKGLKARSLVCDGRIELMRLDLR